MIQIPTSVLLSSVAQTNRMKQFSSEAKASLVLLSENRGVPGGGQGCFLGLPQHGGEGAECSHPHTAVQLGLAGSAGLSVSAYSPLLQPSWSECPGRACTVSSRVVSATDFHWELWCEVPGFLASARGTLWVRETRLSTREERKVRLYYPYSAFNSWELFMGFASDTTT